MIKRILFCAMTLVLLIGCKKVGNLYIIGGPTRVVFTMGAYGNTWVYLYSDPILDTATVKVNGKALINQYAGTPSSYETYFNDTVTPAAATEYKLEVTTNVGNASATAKLPGDFTLTVNPDSVAVGAPVVLSWTQATDAAWYMISVHYDTNGYHTYKDTVFFLTTGTAATIPGAWLNKAGSLYLYLTAGAGPKMEAGAKGNIPNAKGFWIAENYRDHYVQVGSLALSSEPKPPPKVDVRREYLKAIAPYDEDAAEILARMK